MPINSIRPDSIDERKVVLPTADLPQKKVDNTYYVDKKISETPQDVARDPMFNLVPPKDIQTEVSELLQEIKEVSDPTFEALMVTFYKAMIAVNKGDMEMLHQETNFIRKRLQSLDARKAAEYENILKNQRWQEIFGYIGVAGTALGGILAASSVSGGTAPVVGILVATAILAALSANKVAGDPLGKTLFGRRSPQWYQSVEATIQVAATVASAILSGGGATYYAIQATKAATGIGSAVTGYNTTHAEANLKELQNNSLGVDLKQESLAKFIEENAKRLTEIMRTGKETTNIVKVF